MSGKVRASTRRTNLIIHHGVADILDQVDKLIYILSTLQELCDLSSLFQWDEVLKNTIQFPSNSYMLDWILTLESVELPFKDLPPLFLPGLALGSWRAEQFRKPLNSGYQRFYPLATCQRLLGQP